MNGLSLHRPLSCLAALMALGAPSLSAQAAVYADLSIRNLQITAQSLNTVLQTAPTFEIISPTPDFASLIEVSAMTSGSNGPALPTDHFESVYRAGVGTSPFMPIDASAVISTAASFASITRSAGGTGTDLSLSGWALGYSGTRSGTRTDFLASGVLPYNQFIYGNFVLSPYSSVTLSGQLHAYGLTTGGIDLEEGPLEEFLRGGIGMSLTTADYLTQVSEVGRFEIRSQFVNGVYTTADALIDRTVSITLSNNTDTAMYGYVSVSGNVWGFTHANGVSVVPEPASALLWLAGGGLLWACRRRVVSVTPAALPSRP